MISSTSFGSLILTLLQFTNLGSILNHLMEWSKKKKKW